MEKISATVKEAHLRELAETKSIDSACVSGARGGYTIIVRCGTTERILENVRGDVRLFTLDNASKFLRGIGLCRFEVDTSCYEEARMRKARPDRSAALKRTATQLKQQMLL